MSTTSDSRDKILSSLRQSLKVARHLPRAPRSGDGQIVPPPAAPDDDLAQRFAAELTQISGQFFTVPAAEVSGWLLGLMWAREVHDLLAWQAADLPVPGVLDALQAGGMQVIELDCAP